MIDPRRLLALAALLVVMAGCEPQPFFGTEHVVAAAPPLHLIDQHGDPFQLEDHTGNIVLFTFGYVHCPDVCPMTLSIWSRIQQQLGGRGDRVAFALVTVDPERDTEERLKEHMDVFGEGFYGLRGDEDQLRTVYTDYGIHKEKVAFSESAIGYIVDHSTRTFLIDTAGNLRLSYAFGTPAEEIVSDVRRLLKE